MEPYSRGPIIQAAFVPIRYPGVYEATWLHLNLYTSPAILSIFIYLVLFVVIQLKFNEYHIMNQETEKIFNKLKNDETGKIFF